jgi:hypothetical protein
MANYRLLSEIDDIRSDPKFVNFVQHPLYRRIVTFEEVVNNLVNISSSPILCSVMSYFTRAERLNDDSEYI